MNFHHLPTEVILMVLRELPVDECCRLIDFGPAVLGSDLYLLLQVRIFQGPQIVSLNSPRHPGHHGYIQGLAEFETRVASNPVYLRTPPASMTLLIHRLGPGYKEFADTMARWASLFACPDNDPVTQYLKRVPAWNIDIDAKLMLVENPTCVLTLILVFLINLAKHPVASAVHRVRISNCEIGSMYVDKWGALFKRFPNLASLELSGVLIARKHQLFPAFEFPASLRELLLDNNMLGTADDLVFVVMPPLLEVLSLGQCYMSQILSARPLLDHLPRLRHFSCRDNPTLVLDPRLFTGYDAVTVDVRKTNIMGPSLAHLRSHSQVQVLC